MLVQTDYLKVDKIKVELRCKSPTVCGETRTQLRKRQSKKRKKTVVEKASQLLLPPYDEHAFIALRRLIDQLKYDDMLVFGEWQLRYVLLGYGEPHMRLYRKNKLVGIRDIGSWERLATVKKGITLHLLWLGWEPRKTKFVEFGVRTPLSARKWGAGRIG